MSTALAETDYDDVFQIEKAAELGGGVVEDPHPVWADLLRRGPVHKGTLAECMGLAPERSGGGLYRPGITYYSVFSFAAVSDVFTRKDDFSSEVYVDMGTSQHFGDTILNMDGLRHRRFRDLLQPYFQPTPAEMWWRNKVILKFVNDTIDSFAHERSVDLNLRLFGTLPLHTMTAGFGMSLEDGVVFRRHIQRTVYGTDREDRAAGMQAAGRMLEQIVRARQQSPEDDLISKLAHAEIENDDGSHRKLTVDEIVSYCRLIVFAGSETTWRQLGIATFALLNHPEQFAAVVRDRSLLQNAILESTRWNPDPLFPRKVKRDTVLHGVELPAGANLHLCIGAANRDPSRWKDPEKYDIHRPIHRSIAFAAGAHSCLGQHVARQEIATALSALMDRFPKMRWDTDKPRSRLTGSLAQRGPTSLHVLLH